MNDLVPTSPDTPPPSDDLLERFVAGTCSADERAQAEAWLARSPMDRQLLGTLANMEAGAAADMTEAGVSAAWQRVTLQVQAHERRRMEQRDLPARALHQRERRRTFVAVLSGVGAVLLVCLGWFGFTSLFSGANAQATHYATGNAEQATVALPDGSRVFLNVASRLTVPPDFGTRTRTLVLQGQALFTVTPRSGLPFVVDANGTRTQVLGTEFSVRSYDRDSVIIAVASGKVQVGDAVVSAQQVARVAPGANGVVATESVDTEHSFVRKELVFVRTPMRAVIPAANRWYDIDVQLADPSLDVVQLTGQFAGTAVGDFIHALETVLPVRVERRGRTIVLYPTQGRGKS